MATGFDKANPNKAKKKAAKKERANGVTHVVETNQQGAYTYRVQRKRIKVVTLFCNCGRSILVRPEDVEDAPILCSLCNSSFSWQQLTLSLD